MLDLIKANAKAIAVPITALIIWAVTKLADNAGLEIAIDNEAVRGGVAAAIIAVVVWATRNRPKPAE